MCHTLDTTCSVYVVMIMLDIQHSKMDTYQCQKTCWLTLVNVGKHMASSWRAQLSTMCIIVCVFYIWPLFHSNPFFALGFILERAKIDPVGRWTTAPEWRVSWVSMWSCYWRDRVRLRQGIVEQPPSPPQEVGGEGAMASITFLFWTYLYDACYWINWKGCSKFLMHLILHYS
jgi:hypothetical protein